MSFTPKLGAGEFERLFRLYKAAFNQPGVSPTQALKFQDQLREELQKIWDPIDPKPMPLTFNDFRHLMREQFLQRLESENRRFPSV